MTISLELKPELATAVQALAAARGIAVEDYLVGAIEEAALLNGASSSSLEEFDAALDEIAEGSELLPLLDEDAYSRERIYSRVD